jgi:hypothetical protein
MTLDSSFRWNDGREPLLAKFRASGTFIRFQREVREPTLTTGAAIPAVRPARCRVPCFSMIAREIR